MHNFRRLAVIVILSLIIGPLAGSSPAAAGVVPSTTSLTSDPATGKWGGFVHLVATVGPSTATGTVQFYEGVAMRGTANVVEGQARFELWLDSVGTRTFTAKYLGDSVFAETTSDAYVLTIDKGDSLTALSGAPSGQVAPGQAFNLTAAVDPTSTHPTMQTYQPTGTVTLKRNGEAVTTQSLSNSSTVLAAGGLQPGTHSFTGEYSGDGKLASSTSAPLSVTVRRYASVVSSGPEHNDFSCPPPTDPVYCVPNTPVEGDPVTFHARIVKSDSESASPPEGTFPTGTAKVFANDVLVGEPALDATGWVKQEMTLPAGTNAIRVEYQGDSMFAPTTGTINIDVAKSGYVMLSSNGQVYGFGAAASAMSFGLGSGVGGRAVDIEVMPSRKGSWVLNSEGRVVTLRQAPNHGSIPAGALAAGEEATSISSADGGRGYWIFTNRGRVFTFGTAKHRGDMAGKPLNGPVLDSIPTPDGLGYYMVASDGGIFAFGNAVFRGSMGGKPLNRPVQSLVPDPDGVGYWLVASDGGVFAFEAGFRGSMGGKPLNRPVTGMVRWGNGYLMVGEDGGIFSFSDRPFLGSMGSNPPPSPIVSVAIYDGA